MASDFGELLRRLRLDISSLTNALQMLLASFLPKGREVAFTLKTGATSASALHGLGRSYRGGFVVCSDIALALVLAPPDGVSSKTTAVLRASSAPLTDLTVICWVY